MLYLVNKGFRLTVSKVDCMYKTIPGLIEAQGDILKWTVLGPFGIIPTHSELSSSMRFDNSLLWVQWNTLLSVIHNQKFNLDLKT